MKVVKLIGGEQRKNLGTVLQSRRKMKISMKKRGYMAFHKRSHVKCDKDQKTTLSEVRKDRKEVSLL